MEKFEGESSRSEKKLRYDLIPRCIIDGIAERFTIGSEKYGEWKWQSGGEKFFGDTKNHLMNHLLAYFSNDLQDEQSIADHLKSVMWNAGVLLWYETKSPEDKK